MTDKPRVRVSANIQKASNTDMINTTSSYYNTGYQNLIAIQDYVDKEQVRALRWPYSLSTFDKMFYDHDVKTGYFLSQIFVEKAFVNPEVVFNPTSKKSKQAADFIKWNLANMKGTLQQAIRDAYSCKRYGFSILVKKYKPIKSGKYKNKYSYQLDQLSPRAQHTLDFTEPFIMKDGVVTHARQRMPIKYGVTSPTSKALDRQFAKGYVDINRSKFMLFSYDSVNGNPLGTSVLKSIYKPWREKVLIADYQTIGVSKDVGGMPVIYAPSDVLAVAAKDPSSEAAKYIRDLMNQAANLHAGDAAFMLMPSDITEGSQTQRQFEIKLLGVDGGTGKQFDTSALIEERQQAILNSFGASFSTLGQKGGGSYALSDTQKGVHGFYIEKDINYLLEVFNNELIPQLLAMNNIYLEDEDMPKLARGVVDESDKDIASKAIQRATAVGQLPVHPELINEMLAELGYKFRISEDVIENSEKWSEFIDKYLPKSTSRSGDSQNTDSGGANGTSDADSVEDGSIDNQEN